MISAVGIVGNVEKLGLEGTKVEVDRTHVKIDEYCRTGEPGVYAIGDLCGPPWLAHKASHEGVVCVEKIAGLNDVHPINWNNIPGCTYCRPQVASVGLTEAQAKAEGHEVKVGRFPFIGNGKAIAMGEPEGMVKTVFDAKTGELLGAHMCGAEVTETDPGLCDRTHAGDDRGRADAHRVPASRPSARPCTRPCLTRTAAPSTSSRAPIPSSLGARSPPEGLSS